MRNFITLLLLMFSLCFETIGQSLDENCRPIPPPPQCQRIVDQIGEREDFFATAINRLRETRARNEIERKKISDQIINLQRQRNSELNGLRADLQRCRDQFNIVPRRQDAPTSLNAVFVGNVEARTTDSAARGPFFRDVRVGLRFSRNRCVVEITSFPPLQFDTDPLPIVGRLTITVSKIGGGTGQFFPVSGQMNLPLRLKADVPIIDDSEASATLTTGNSVSVNGTFNETGIPLTRTNNAPLDSCGRTVNGTRIECPIAVAATTVFEGGRLDDDEGSIIITGNITVPLPPPSESDSPRARCLQQCESDYDQCRERPVRPPQQPPNCRALRNSCEARCPRQ